MLSLLNFVVDTINTALQLGNMFLSSLSSLTRLIPTFTTYTAALFVWLPQPYFLFASLGLTISVVLFIIGRPT